MKTNTQFLNSLWASKSHRWLLAFACLLACTQEIDNRAKSNDSVTLNSRELNLGKGYASEVFGVGNTTPILKTGGEILRTGRPHRAKGYVDRNMSKPSKQLSLQWKAMADPFPKAIFEYPGTRLNQKPRFDSIASNLEASQAFVLINDQGDTLPTNTPIKIEGRQLILKHPSATPALPPLQDNTAVLELKRIGLDQGLSNSSITSMVEDQAGNMWISSWGGGLSKYDGQSFWHYGHEEGLASTGLDPLILDKRGWLWMCGHDAGLMVYDGNVLKQYATQEGMISNSIHGLFEDRKGHIWIMGEKGVSRFDGIHFTHFSTQEGLTGNWFHHAFEDKKGHIWFHGNKGLLARFDGKQFTNFGVYSTDTEEKLAYVFQDQFGNDWLTSGSHIICFDGEQMTLYDSPEEGRLRYFEDKENGVIWLAKKGGILFRYDGQVMKRIWLNDDYKEFFASAITKDNAGNLWISYIGKGIVIYNENGFTHGGKSLQCVLVDQQGQHWFGYEGQGLGRYKDGQYWQVDVELGYEDVRDILEDSAGNIWMATCSGLGRYDGERLSFFQLSDHKTQCANSLLMDRNGHIWVTYNKGVVVRYDGASFRVYHTEDGLSQYNITSIIEDQTGTIWMGSMGGGLTLYDGSSFTTYSEKEGMSSNRIVTLLEDNQGNIWAGTDDVGLIGFDGQTFHFLTKKDGLCSNGLAALSLDEQGRIWASTIKGLNVLRPVPDGEPFHYECFNYLKKDGLLDDDFLWNSSFIDPDNVLWLGHRRTTTLVDLNTYIAPSHIPKVSLDQLAINEQFLDFRQLDQSNQRGALSYTDVPLFSNYPSDLKLSFDYNHLTFYFSATDWTAPHQLKYSYRIAGLSKEWSTPSPEAKADFRSLPSGSFTFELRAKGPAGQWGPTFSYPFEIAPPWWQSWWAYIGYTLALLSLGLAINRFQLRRQMEKQETLRLKELDEFKNEFYTNITHEFRTPLTIISGMVEQIQNRPDAWRDKGLKMIKENAHGLLSLVNQILDLRKLESSTLALNMVQGDVLAYIRQISESYQSYAQGKGLKLHLMIELGQLVMDYDPDKLLRILSNLLSNAIKYSEEGDDIYLEVRQEKENPDELGQLRISVRDTGIGIPEDQLPHIFDRFFQIEPQVANGQDTAGNRNAHWIGGSSGVGLALTKELVDLMQGNIRVHSQLGRGTHFIVNLPIHQKSKVEVGEKFFQIQQAVLERDFVSATRPSKEPSQSMQINSETDLAASPSARVLIVEDNPDVTQYLRACLEETYQLRIARNGQRGIDVAIQWVPDLIVSDVMMPEKNGFELCETLKKDERTSHIPIVLLTAKADLESKIDGLERGADAYLTKPFQQKELLVRLRKLLEIRQTLQARYGAFMNGEKIGIRSTKSFSSEDLFMEKLQKTLQDHLSDPNFQVVNLCKQMVMSRTQLHNKIKALTGKSTSIYVRTFRLQKARRLLETSDMNVSEVAYEVGFKDPSYFSRTFADTFGLPPTQVKKNYN
ncbi:MAG: two-component regulator propeller domain-containing protein [Bacteroidota bacterium]